MYDVPGDFLLTYDSKYTELHTDSSDFEDSCPAPITPKLGNHSLIKRKLCSKSKRKTSTASCNSQACTVTDVGSREMWESQTIVSQNGEEIDLEFRRRYQNRKSKVLDSGDQIQTIKSKRSLMRHKVIPCLSSMFGRPSNNVKQMSIIKENQVENVNIDNGCQASRVNREHKIRKFNRRQQCYAVQPVYAVDGNVHAKSTPFQHTKIIREPLANHRMVENEYTNVNYSLTSSSEGTGSRRFLQRKKEKNKKNKESCNMAKEFMKYDERMKRRNREQQCPSKLNSKTPYHIYTTPYQYQQRNNTGCSPMGSNNISGNELPSTCSGFWEYLFNKINARYQNDGTTLFKPCKCNAVVEESPRCDPIKCEKYSQPEPQQYNNYPESAKVDSCACPTPPRNLNDKNQRSGQNPPFKIKGSPKDKVECKCFSTNPKSQPKPSPTPAAPYQYSPKPPASSGSDSSPRPCQIPHDEITATLSKKYNGEILCIHNPPCVLINGCLNLPPAKENMTTDLWPVLQDSNGYHMYTRTLGRQQDGVRYGPESLELRQCQITDESCQHFPPSIGMKSFKNTDESCQYQIPSIELKELMITDDCCQYRHSQFEMQAKRFTTNESCQYFPPLIDVETMKSSQTKQEKIIQSICNHKPPCEVVRKCCKPKYDPELQNSCVHVPMCEKVPVCLMELKNQNQSISSCPHKPKCAELPICTRNFIILTAKEEAATQVRPKAKMVCRHEPPCILIPKCLARVCDGYIPYDAIPDCIHQPMCEMIPACCRKSGKEMVSVCSQYPNQCCIV